MTETLYMRSNLVDLTVYLHHETKPGNLDEGAYLVSDDGDKGKAVWFPKSLTELHGIESGTPGNIFEMTVPENVAIEKGFL